MVNISDDELIADVKRVFKKLGSEPTLSEYDKFGSYSPSTVSRRLGDGSWIKSLDNLGYDVSERGNKDKSNEELRIDINKVYNQLERIPTGKEYDEFGEYSQGTVARRFGDGSWSKSISELNYDSSELGIKISDDKLIKDVKIVSEKIGHTPSHKEYEKHGNHSSRTISKRFGNNSWEEALQELGYDTENVRKQINQKALKKDLLNVTDKLGHVPTRPEYKEHGIYSPNTALSRLGSGSWGDVVETIKEQRGILQKVSYGELSEDVTYVVNKLESVPTEDEYNLISEYTSQLVANRFGGGSWDKALEQLNHK